MPNRSEDGFRRYIREAKTVFGVTFCAQLKRNRCLALRPYPFCSETGVVAFYIRAHPKRGRFFGVTFREAKLVYHMALHSCPSGAKSVFGVTFVAICSETGVRHFTFVPISSETGAWRYIREAKSLFGVTFVSILSGTGDWRYVRLHLK